MFNFQKEVIVNKPADITIDEKGIAITREANYKKDGVVDKTIYHTAGDHGWGAFANVILRKDSPLLGKHVQYQFEFGMGGAAYYGEFGTALYRFKKPIVFDVVLPTDIAAAKEVVKAAIQKAIAQYPEFEYAEVPLPLDAGWLCEVITSKEVGSHGNPDIAAKRVAVYSYECDDRCSGSSEELVLIEEVYLKKGVGGNYVSGNAGTPEFGTYRYLLRNLRLPTNENLRFNSPMKPEMPIEGVMYDQISFGYEVKRTGLGGLSVVGQENTSLVNATMFVPQTAWADIKAKLEEQGYTIVEKTVLPREVNEINILPDANAVKEDLKN
ncbi:MAG: hypothetical protein KBT03_08950 [Bacteroidales bacterium]|nr:hypothetical protein [Candidatus Scybalousia scybalohippi]